MAWRRRIEGAMVSFCTQTMAFLVVVSAAAEDPRIPWLNHVDPSAGRHEIHTIATEAGVSVSDGLTYDAVTLFHDRQRLINR